LAACTVLTFVAGGLSETYLIPQNVAIALALLVASAGWRTRWPGARVAAAGCAAALVGGVLALLAIVVAPATAVRVGGSPADLWLASSAAIATGAFQAVRLVRYFLPTLALCVLVPVLLSSPARRAISDSSQARNDSVQWRTVLLVTAVVAIVVPFCYFPSFYASNGNPPSRSLIVPGSLLIVYATFLGYALRVRLPRRVAMAGLLALAVVPLGIAAVSFPERAQAAQYAVLWDSEDQLIRTARDGGATDLVVPPLPTYLGENFVGPNAGDWFNNCVARYYAVRTIAASS
jgi:hypothetical protein